MKNDIEVLIRGIVERRGGKLEKERQKNDSLMLIGSNREGENSGIEIFFKDKNSIIITLHHQRFCYESKTMGYKLLTLYEGEPELKTVAQCIERAIELIIKREINVKEEIIDFPEWKRYSRGEWKRIYLENIPSFK